MKFPHWVGNTEEYVDDLHEVLEAESVVKVLLSCWYSSWAIWSLWCLTSMSSCLAFRSSSADAKYDLNISSCKDLHSDLGSVSWVRSKMTFFQVFQFHVKIGRFFFTILTVNVVDIINSSLVIVGLLPTYWQFVSNTFSKVSRFG